MGEAKAVEAKAAGEAKAIEVKATGEAQATKLKAAADAEAIELKAETNERKRLKVVMLIKTTLLCLNLKSKSRLFKLFAKH